MIEAELLILSYLLTFRAGIDSSRHGHGKPMWTFRKSTPDSSSPVCVNGMLFMVSNNGIATCIDLRSGQILWQHRLATGNYFASVVAGADKVYFLSVQGTCSVVEAAPKFRLLAKNRLVGEFYATPALDSGEIILRSRKRLFAIH